MGVEAAAVVARARATGAARTFHDVFSASGAGETRGASARVASICGVVGDAASTVAAWHRRAMVFVRTFCSCELKYNSYVRDEVGNQLVKTRHTPV